MTTETELRDRKFFDNMTKDQLVNECYLLNTLLVQMKEETTFETAKQQDDGLPSD